MPLPVVVYALGFSQWKRRSLIACLSDREVRFVPSAKRIPEGATVVVWGMQPIADADSRGLTLLRVEDGFLRSVGLGADLVRPVSWVIDGYGMYYDATRPSELEVILEQTSFGSDLLERAAALRQRIVATGLTKYNVGAATWRRPPDNRFVILVPGQVESDASLAYGAPATRSNLQLLQAVRRSNPKAYVLYKPHPDVVAGLRRAGRGEDEAGQWCDEIVIDAPMGELLNAVDEVHCMTSLAGFEALLRGKKVVCYGQPFYAGWGLTTDILPLQRRERRLTIDELVAGALILYPCYLDRRQTRRITPEEALDELIAWRAQHKTGPWLMFWRWILRRVVGVR